MDHSRDSIEAFLGNVRRELEEAWERGEEPLCCAIFRRGGLQCGNSIWTPLPTEEEVPQSMVETVPDLPDAQTVAETTATEDAILAVLAQAHTPIKITTIAKRAGAISLDYFRKVVRCLAKKGKVIAVDESRYWLAGRPLPEAKIE